MTGIDGVWVHGMNVQVEQDHRVEYIHRTKLGTTIGQKLGTSNCFYFTIPTPYDLTKSETTPGTQNTTKISDVFVDFYSGIKRKQ